jgi:hypothetical protein
VELSRGGVNGKAGIVVMNKDFPCKCGHVQGCHNMELNFIYHMCLKRECLCCDFIADNLKYLESKI